MHITFGRRARLAVLGAGLITAAAAALSSSAAAFADTADTGGSATVTIPRSVIVGLAKHGVIALAGAPASASYTAGTSNFSSTDAYTFTVTGGTGEISNFSGIVDLGGAITLINAAHSQTVTISGLRLNFFTGALTGQIGTSTTQTTLAWIGGSLASSTGTGTETFSASQLAIATKGATALNAALGVRAFTHGTSLGAFATTYDVTIT
jgi:hypothetical protein